MAKRSASSDDAPHHRKRQMNIEITKTTGIRVPEAEKHEIHSSRDLQLLLAFDQDVGPVPRQKIQSFKSFLASIAYAVESDDRSAKRALLLEYMQSRAPPEGKEPSAYLGDIIKTWHFAAQSNADSLFTSVFTVLALLLKSISGLIEFREYGNRLCTSLLHDDQIKLFDRGLGTHRAKDYLISPCLQLLTEIVAFDGGYAAKKVYRLREITFKRLDVFLGMRKDTHSGVIKGPKRRSVRENALGYLFANLRLQSSDAKKNIITQGKVLRGLLDNVAEDSPSIILEILGVLRRDIAIDGGLSQTVKGRFFNHWTLGRLVTLYGYDESASLSDSHQGVQSSVHDFLVYLCTSPGLGLVEKLSASTAEVHAVTVDKGLQLESPSQPYITNELRDDTRPAGKNPRLQLFLQTLRPYASVLQRDLILTVFRNLPEMIPDYFSSGKAFLSDPKLTTIWIGYCSFLIAIIAIPLPEYLTSPRTDDTAPHLYGSLIEGIMPKPCNQKTLTRCLNQSVNLVKFFTLQILNTAFEKMAEVLERCEDIQHYANDEKSCLAWCRTVSKLRDEFCGRVPELKHVITQLRSCPRNSTVLRESITRLIASYYKVIPQVALEEKVDLSVTLSTALVDVDSLDVNSDERGMPLLELEHVLEIAHRAPNMQWWHKPGSMQLSLFTMLLRLYLDRIRFDTKSEQLRTLLKTVVTENHILRSNTSMAAVDRLIISLQASEDWKASSRVFEFLDHCILRLVRKPVYYYDILANLVTAAELDINPRDCQVDLLLIAIMDQWRFLVGSADAPTVTNVSQWLVRLIEVMDLENNNNENLPLRGETTKLLSQIRDQLKSEIQETDCRAVFERTLEERPDLGVLRKSTAASTTGEARHMSRTVGSPPKQYSELPDTFLPPGPPEEHEDHPGLHQWTRHEVQDAISEGHVKALILCLCSKHVEIRKQALTGVRAFMIKLEGSGNSEWQQTYVLVGEIVETAAKIIANDPLPFYAGILAAALLIVLEEPLHPMYAKVNEFLNRVPEWNVKRLPSYWVDRILMNSPTDDDGYHQEAEWLLDGLIDGLRTSTDMEIYRKCDIFERLLSFSASPSLPEPCFQKILDLLFRCTYIEGSSTLITRCGLTSWIFSCLATHRNNERTGERLTSLAWRAYETSDEERVDDWANGTLRCKLDSHLMTRR